MRCIGVYLVHPMYTIETTFGIQIFVLVANDFWIGNPATEVQTVNSSIYY